MEWVCKKADRWRPPAPARARLTCARPQCVCTLPSRSCYNVYDSAVPFGASHRAPLCQPATLLTAGSWQLAAPNTNGRPGPTPRATCLSAGGYKMSGVGRDKGECACRHAGREQGAGQWRALPVAATLVMAARTPAHAQLHVPPALPLLINHADPCARRRAAPLHTGQPSTHRTVECRAAAAPPLHRPCQQRRAWRAVPAAVTHACPILAACWDLPAQVKAVYQSLDTNQPWL